MTNVGIIGGAGYTGGELIRLLLRHPQVNIAFVHSRSQAGSPITTVHKDLIGETDLKFSAEIDTKNIDVLFFCTGHGESAVLLQENPQWLNCKIIDLSQDFRIKNEKHSFIYGLPELQAEAIKKAQYIANPGCFATAIQLAVLPLANAQLLPEVHIHAITGSTGAGQKPTETNQFSWRNNNISVYKAFEHQHLKEITQSIKQLQSNFAQDINFIPVRGNFARGILATAYLDCPLSQQETEQLYKDYYKNAAFTFLAKDLDLKMVVNTNKCLISVEKKGKKLFITSIIDNLLKGASGQALQNMNLLCGYPENTGLLLKPVAF
jgi:N-acetyl-gamma-glutamyl-phosphate reductase